MVDPTAQLGISGFVVALLLTAIKIVWDKYQKALAEKDAITAVVLPALQQAQSTMADMSRAIERLYDHSPTRGRGDD